MVKTTSADIVRVLKPFRCSNDHKHAERGGKYTVETGNYNRTLSSLIHQGLNAENWRGVALSVVETYSHNGRHLGFPLWSAAVTRIIPANTAEFKSEKCKAAEAKEVGRLRGIKVWLEDAVREWASVCKDDDFDDAMSGRIFVIMGEKGSEMPDPKDREIKARVVFEGSMIFTKSGRPAAELY